jgi:uncharacterized membrane protein
MAKIRPATALFVVALFVGAVVVAQWALEGGFSRQAFTRVSPDRQGRVEIDTSDLAAGQVRFFRFLNAGNQEVKFFVGRDGDGTLQVAYDASEVCYKFNRGFRVEDGWVVCNKCDKAFKLAEVNEGRGGCAPVPVPHSHRGDLLTLREADILGGWRYFR